MNSLYKELGGTYYQEGGLPALPNLTPPLSPHIGIWGIRWKSYQLKNRGPLYIVPLLRGKLDAHPEEVDHQTEDMFA